MRRIIQVLGMLDDLLEVALRALARTLVRPLTFALVLVLAGVGSQVRSLPSRKHVPPAKPVAAAPAVVEKPIAFSVASTDTSGAPSASIRVEGLALDVRVGAIIPPLELGTPRLIITAIDDDGVTAWDCSLRRVRRETQEKLSARLRDGGKGFKVNAIAGDAPHYVAVIEYEGQTYIVQNGTSVPEEGPKEELRITNVGAASVTAEGRGKNRVDTLDLDGI